MSEKDRAMATVTGKFGHQDIWFLRYAREIRTYRQIDTLQYSTLLPRRRNQ